MDDDSGKESKKDEIEAVTKMFDPKAIVTPMEYMTLPNRFQVPCSVFVARRGTEEV
jgi:hypothetical protein